MSKEEIDEIIETIRLVLLDLKDEFDSLKGSIYSPNKSNNFFEIVLKCQYFVGDDIEKIDKQDIRYLYKKSKFIETVIKVIERLKNALRMKVHTTNLWEFDSWQNQFEIKIKLS